MDTIEQLKLRIAELEAENKQLRTLLKLPVKYSESVVKEDNVYDQNQGKRIIRYSITKDAANYFYSLFWAEKMFMLCVWLIKVRVRQLIIHSV